MSDLISREAAIDAVNDLAKWYCETYHETRPTVMAVIDMLERLPSEQLEKTQLSEEDTTSDCISRQAAIDILYNFAGCVVDTPNGDYRRAYEASRHELETLPPAQPNLQPSCNQLATNTIDRQAAIDALKEHRALFCDNTPDTFSKLSYGEKCRVDELDTAISTLVNLPSAQQWILCSERPPEEDEQVFVYLFDASPYIAWVCDGRWHTEEFVLDEDEEPAAWMPLPEPYKERREE